MNSITLVVIARDEARCIERCLNSFAPHVDHLVVLDTGSRDDTVVRARRLGAQVGHFAWIDDFAAARNAALELAGPGWHLVADADEWLESGGPTLRAWCHDQQAAAHPMDESTSHRNPTGAYRSLPAPSVGMPASPPPTVGRVLVRNTFDAQGQWGVAVAPLPRLLSPDIRYAGRVHEQPQVASTTRVVDTALVFGHDGYCEAQRQRKRGRNERLLRRSLDEQPDNGYLQYQMGCEWLAQGDAVEAQRAFERALASTPPQADYRADLVRRHLVVLQTLRAWAQAADFAEAELPVQGDSPYFMLTLGNLFWNWCEDQPDHAGALLPPAHEAWLRALHLAREGGGRGVQMEQTGVHAALSLAALHRRWGDEGRAAEYEALAHSPPFLAA